jgi:hypothetical protein
MPTHASARSREQTADRGAVSAVLLLGAVTLVGAAVAISRGFYHPGALALATAALALVVLDLKGLDCPSAEGWARAFLPWAIAAPLGLGLLSLLVLTPGGSLPAGASLRWHRVGVAVAGLLGLSYVVQARPRIARLRFPALVAVYVALGVGMIWTVPEPPIDVWLFQQRAVDYWLAGENPWASTYPDIYGVPDFYPPAYMRDGQVYSFIYPPFVMLLGIPARVLLGDVRYGLLAAVAGAACFALAAGRRLGLASRRAEVVAAAMMFHPRALFLIEQGWVDPYLACAASATVWALAGRHAVAMRVAVAAFIGAKQYAALWLVALLDGRRFGSRDTAWAIALAAAVILPFFLWAPADFLGGVVLTPLSNPFRMDALSIPAMVAALTGARLPGALGFAAAAAVAALGIRCRRGVGGEARLGAAMFLAFFLLGKQAFLNYYWLVGSLLCLASVEALARIEHP